MINVYGEVSKSILNKVNENIYLILELFTESCKAMDFETFLAEIFPKHYLRKNINRCIETVEELMEYTTDTYKHDLTPLQEYALFHLLEWWIDVSDFEFDQAVGEKEIITDDDKYISDNINNVEEYKSFMFSDWDFLDEFLASYVEAYKSYGPMIKELYDNDLDDYVELLPDDKKKEYYMAKGRFELLSKEDENFNNEQLVIKQIYNALKAREKYPKRLQDTSETELSDDIADIVRENLHSNNLIITREMPNGFAKKCIGECDFYIYTYIDGVYKIISIGENKEWGKYEKQLKQLIGYMTNDVQFGFTILFNKSVQPNTALAKRIEILKDFSVEVNGEKCFGVVGGILESKVMNNVLLTKHENPEKKGSYFRIYHFIINSHLEERQKSAIDAR
ncbi:hypothetical protein H9660_02185 [Clostridium sp. Sa3CUN1]|uniref:Uncharacterized protein n=1 Tax=Clostridium gallinarum TaxID=2762246 RepID=A0ABR8Q0K2_9CLOT|nr:hypothetical protein [Clostridium gallinarum]MBD7913947.1 hypothetical protein [Clostridium gallinarum]